MLYHHNNNNVYPLHILFSNMIASTKPKRPMNLLSHCRRCASVRKYDKYSSKIAANLKRLKPSGTALGLKPNIFTVMHMKNLKHYTKYARDQSKALTSNLAVGVQELIPQTWCFIKLLIIDRHLVESVLPFPLSDVELDLLCNSTSISDLPEVDNDLSLSFNMTYHYQKHLSVHLKFQKVLY